MGQTLPVKPYFSLFEANKQLVCRVTFAEAEKLDSMIRKSSPRITLRNKINGLE